MKKSRIIIPALAMIAFSVAASVTGAVAWFTAQRTALVNAGTYAVVKTTSDLEVTLTAGVGTSVNNNTVTVNGKLTDGSFDHIAKNIYVPNESGTAIATNGQIALADANATNLKRGTTGTGDAEQNVYTAITFDLTFTVTFGAANSDVALLMDNTPNHTKFAVSDNSTAKTAKGFRMAFVAQSDDGVTKVLADLQEDANCYYINSASADLTLDYDYVDPDAENPVLDDSTHAGVRYVSPALIDSATAETLPTVPTAKATLEARKDYLGFFDHLDKDANSKVSLSYKVVCWYDGTDPEIINRAAADFQAVVATLHFEAKDIA